MGAYLEYPMVAHATWSNNGFISTFSLKLFGDIGVVDLAGSVVIQTTGGTIALAAACILGLVRVASTMRTVAS